MTSAQKVSKAGNPNKKNTTIDLTEERVREIVRDEIKRWLNEIQGESRKNMPKTAYIIDDFKPRS